jgi:hypothetical protein
MLRVCTVLLAAAVVVQRQAGAQANAKRVFWEEGTGRRHGEALALFKLR